MIDYILCDCISRAFKLAKYRKKSICAIGSALYVHRSGASTAFNIVRHTRGKVDNNCNSIIERDSRRFKLIQPIRGTSPELWELTELGRELCNDIMNEYNRRISEGDKPVKTVKK